MKPSKVCNRLVERSDTCGRMIAPPSPTSERSNKRMCSWTSSRFYPVWGVCAAGVASLHPRLQKVRPLLKSHDGAFLGSYVALCKRFILPGVNNWQCPLFHCAIFLYAYRHNRRCYACVPPFLRYFQALPGQPATVIMTQTDIKNTGYSMILEYPVFCFSYLVIILSPSLHRHAQFR